jgi:glutamyl-tRNA synthetase
MLQSGFGFNPAFNKEIISGVLKDIGEKTDLSKDEQTWFADLKAIAETHRFAQNNKIFKQNPMQYIGHVGDVAEMLRIALTGSKQSPNLYYVMQILGLDRIRNRIGKVIDKLH